MSIPVEHDYIGLSEACLMETKMSCSVSSPSVLKETELRLGLPGSWSPERKATTELSLFAKDLVEKNTLKIFVSGAKRGFSDTCKKCEFSTPTPMAVEDKKSAPSQLVGWPPVRSFRKNSVGSYVKVSMDGAPYLRKVDVKTYTNYADLLSALEKMFSCFTIGQFNSDGLPGLSERHLVDLLNGSEYVLTYQDKDGDWMLLGDVPWEMFIDSCKRMRIMKSSEAIGLAPKAMSKSKNQIVS